MQIRYQEKHIRHCQLDLGAHCHMLQCLLSLPLLLRCYLIMAVQFYLLTACSKDRYVVSKNTKYNCITARFDQISRERYSWSNKPWGHDAISQAMMFKPFVSST